MLGACTVSRAEAVASTPTPTDRVQIHETITNGFVHPGIGLTKAILDDAREQVMAKREPWYSGFQQLAADPNAATKISIRNQSRTDPNKPDSVAFDNPGFQWRLGIDGDTAYKQTLMYYFTGDKTYRVNAMNIIRIWSQLDPAKFREYPDAHIHAPYPVKSLIAAAELLRYTSTDDPALTWTDTDTSNFESNFINPAIHTFFDGNGWFMNQAGYPLAASMAGFIFTNDRASYSKRVEWFTVDKTAPNKGCCFSIKDLARLVDTDATTGIKVAHPQVQLVEMGRDQAHAGDDAEIFTNIARLMYAQNTRVDPVSGEISTANDAVGAYEFFGGRILAADDYFCRFMLGYDTPWIAVAYSIGPDGKAVAVYPRIADNYRGRIRELEIWDLYYYYTYTKHMDVAKIAPYYYEAFSKRIVSSNTEWLYIPKYATGEAAKIPPTVQEPDAVEVVRRLTCLGKNVNVRIEGDNAFLRATPSSPDAKFAFLSCATDSKTVALSVRTTGTASMAMSGFEKPWLLPNTQGKWRTVSYTMGKLEHFPNIVFASITGTPKTTVDIDTLYRNPGTTALPPTFKSGQTVLRAVAYAGAPITLDFSAMSADGRSAVTYTSLDKPSGSALDPTTGTFAWKPAKAGEYWFIVQAASGEMVAPCAEQIDVATDRLAAIKLAQAGFDPRASYVSATLKRYEASSDDVASSAKTASDVEFVQKLSQMQKATKALELLTPLLPDGSMDYTKVVQTLTAGDWLGVLADGNCDTWVSADATKGRNLTFDFGPNFTFSATAFAIQGRLNFEDRIADTKVFGSNDGSNWTELTPQACGAATELTRMEVAERFATSTFRYFRLQKQGGSLFEPSELRIFGHRQEVITASNGPNP